MKLGPDSEYICLIPPSPDAPVHLPEEQQEEATPAQSWSLLQPLSGKCLYVRASVFLAPLVHADNTCQHRQHWFTYSYCHNQDIRQFRELPQLAHSPGILFLFLPFVRLNQRFERRSRAPGRPRGMYNFGPLAVKLIYRPVGIIHTWAGAAYGRTWG